MKPVSAHWSTLSVLLDQALDLPAAARADWLAQRTDLPPELSSTLRELLAAHEDRSTAATLDRAPVLPALRDPGRMGVGVVATGLAAGDRVGPYRLVRELGRGGMADVWLAERADGAFTRAVALKLPRVTRLRRDLLVRFARERDILSRLEHPGIARLYDAGIGADGMPYMAMEYVDGEPINAWCDARGLDIATRLRLFTQLLDAVQYAHANLVIHRDLKPSNLLVNRDGQLRLLDFGIAKLLATDDAAEETELTRSVGRALTPEYASPEQRRGDPLTTASDLYSLGVVLYELLCGERPRRLPQPPGISADDESAALDAVAPSTRLSDAAAQVRGGTRAAVTRALTGDLDAIVLKAIQHAPAQRYVTAEAFARDVQRHLRGEAISALRRSRWRSAWRQAQRQRRPIAAGAGAATAFGVAVGFGATALIMAALAVGIALALWQARRATQARDRALALATRNEAVSEFLNTLLAHAARSGKAVTPDQLLARSEQLVEREFRDNAEHRGVVLAMIGMLRHTLGQTSEAERLLTRALDAARDGDDLALRDTLRSQRAIAVGWAGRVDEATAILRQVLARPDIEPEPMAEALSYLATLAQRTNDAVGALEHATAALAALRRSRRVSPSLEASFLANLGFSLHLNGRNDEADRHYEAAYQRLTQLGRERGPNAVAILNNWALVNERAGDARRALALYERSLSIIAADDDAAQPPAYLISNRARTLEFIGRFDEAILAYEHAIAVADATGSAMASRHARVGRVSALLAAERLDAAAAHWAQVTDGPAVTVPEGSPVALMALLVSAQLSFAQGDPAGASAQWRQVIEAGERQATTVMALIGLSRIAAAAAHLQDAEHHARRALSIATALQGSKPSSFRTGLAWWSLAEALQAGGRTDEARSATTAAQRHLVAIVEPDHPVRRAIDLPPPASPVAAPPLDRG